MSESLHGCGYQPTSSSLTLVSLQLPVEESSSSAGSSRAATSLLGGRAGEVNQEWCKEGEVTQEDEDEEAEV